MKTRRGILVRAEIRELFLSRRIFHFIPLLMAGAVGMAWMYQVGSPFAPIVIITVLGLEPQFSNALFRTPNELEALGLMPISWHEVLLAKNIAAIIHVGIFFTFASMILIYFSPDLPSGEQALDAALYVFTVLFPLLHLGNVQSVRSPRRYSGMRLDDVVQAVWMALNLALVSLPYYLFDQVNHSRAFCLAYGIGTWWYWYRFSLRKSAAELAHRYPELCRTP